MNSTDLIKRKRPTETVERQAGDAISGGERQNTQTVTLAQASSASVLPITISKPGWRVRALKHVANVQFSNVDKHTFEDEVPVQLCNYTDVYKNDLIVPDMDFMQASATPAEIKKFRLRENDVIITKDSETWEDIAIPAHVTASMDGVLCGYHLAQLRPRPDALRGKFLFYCLKARPVAYHFNISAFGITRFGLSNADIGRAPIPVPPLDTQDDIVTYLDRETRRIDTIIEKNRRLLELIDEKRTAFISHAITKGLNPDHKLVPSGVRPLGHIAEGWRPMRLKFLKLGAFQYGANEAALSEDDSQPRFLRITDLNSDGTLREDTFRSLPEDLAAAYLLQDEDLLFARSGATVGKAFRYRTSMGRACFAGYLIRFRADRRKVLPAFVELFTQSLPYWEQVRSGLIQATIQNVSAERYGDMWLALPPVEDQPVLIEKITERLTEFSGIAAKVARAIDLLRERRLALISAAVSGKLEVPSS
jgi:type I restriction enzyme S subunit